MKTWANQATLNKSLKIIWGKRIISNSNKIQPLLNASKAGETIPVGSLKPRTIQETSKNLVTSWWAKD